MMTAAAMMMKFIRSLGGFFRAPSAAASTAISVFCHRRCTSSLGKKEREREIGRPRLMAGNGWLSLTEKRAREWNWGRRHNKKTPARQMLINCTIEVREREREKEKERERAWEKILKFKSIFILFSPILILLPTAPLSSLAHHFAPLLWNRLRANWSRSGCFLAELYSSSCSGYTVSQIENAAHFNKARSLLPYSFRRFALGRRLAWFPLSFFCLSFSLFYSSAQVLTEASNIEAEEEDEKKKWQKCRKQSGDERELLRQSGLICMPAHTQTQSFFCCVLGHHLGEWKERANHWGYHH